MDMICSRLSTAQGPAITAMRGPPMRTGPTWISVSAFLNSRDASLKGELMGMTRATPGSTSTSRASMEERPTAPKIVSSSPRISRTRNPRASRNERTASLRTSVIPC